MAFEINQTSQFQPAVVQDGNGWFHMVFRSEDNSNRVLYVQSPNGQPGTWIASNDNFETRQTSSAAPALAVARIPEAPPYAGRSLLVCAFIANDPSNRILYTYLHLPPTNFVGPDKPSPPKFPVTAGWEAANGAQTPQVSNDSARGISALARGPGVNPFGWRVYYLSNDPSDRLLGANIPTDAGPTLDFAVGDETSQFQPSVIFDSRRNTFHMVFLSQDNSNSLLYITSADGRYWSNATYIQQTSHAAPALALCQFLRPNLAEHWLDLVSNRLAVVFIANDPSNQILYTWRNLDDADIHFVDAQPVPDESARAVSALGSGNSVTVFFLSNDPSNRLLQAGFELP